MNSLWLGEGHLVHVQGSGFIFPFSERYSRFRLRDIQCLSITETNRIGWILLYLFISLGFFGVVAAIFSANGGMLDLIGPVAWGFISFFALTALIFLALLTRTLLLGPTCKTCLQTNLKSEYLVPLNRLKTATEATEMLAELIQKSQSDL